MSRTLLSLYRLDRSLLGELSTQLRAVLQSDDRAGFSRLLELGGELSARVEQAARLVDLMLLPEADVTAAPLFASLRRIAKRSALHHVWTSEAASLEGRLRAYDVVRDESEVADAIDRLLDVSLLPWFLRPLGCTGGWLEDSERSELAERMEALSPALPDEVKAFVEALGGMDGDALVHDRL